MSGVIAVSVQGAAVVSGTKRQHSGNVEGSPKQARLETDAEDMDIDESGRYIVLCDSCWQWQIGDSAAIQAKSGTVMQQYGIKLATDIWRVWLTLAHCCLMTSMCWSFCTIVPCVTKKYNVVLAYTLVMLQQVVTLRINPLLSQDHEMGWALNLYIMLHSCEREGHDN